MVREGGWSVRQGGGAHSGDGVRAKDAEGLAAQLQRLAAALAGLGPAALTGDAAVEDHRVVVGPDEVVAKSVDRRHLPPAELSGSPSGCARETEKE